MNTAAYASAGRGIGDTIRGAARYGTKTVQHERLQAPVAFMKKKMLHSTIGK